MDTAHYVTTGEIFLYPTLSPPLVLSHLLIQCSLFPFWDLPAYPITAVTCNTRSTPAALLQWLPTWCTIFYSLERARQAGQLRRSHPNAPLGMEDMKPQLFIIFVPWQSIVGTGQVSCELLVDVLNVMIGFSLGESREEPYLIWTWVEHPRRMASTWVTAHLSSWSSCVTSQCLHGWQYSTLYSVLFG